MKVLSLFDGISACQQALKNLGIECQYYASEIDKYAIQITQKNFPNTVQLGDIKKLLFDGNFKGFATFTDKQFLPIQIPFIDLLVAGFPCQSFSIAGNRKGFDDERGDLFFELLRIIKEVKPKYFLLENVNSMSKENKKIICDKLGIDFIMIDSAKLTAQQRKRIYFVGKLQEDGTYKKVEIEQPQDRGVLLKDVLESGLPYQDKSHSLTASYDGAVFWNSLEKRQRSMVAEPVRLGHFNKGGQADRIYSVQGKSINLSANGGGGGAKTGLYKIDLPDGDYIVRKLTPVECERLQGFSDNYSDNVSNTQRYKALGNSFTVPVIEHILRHLDI